MPSAGSDGIRDAGAGVSPPLHLKPATAACWLHVADEYELQSHHLRLLGLAASAWDRAEEARAALEQHGLTYVDRFGAPRTRPEVAIERDSRIGFARLIRDLHLDAAETPGGFVGGDD